MKNFLLLCMMAVLSLTSCIMDEPECYQNDSAVAIAKFQETFYYEDGKPKLVQMEDSTTWVVGVSSGSRVCEIFGDITGVCINPSRAYNYEYKSNDGDVVIGIEGDLQPNEKAVYAIMNVYIPYYPEIREIHFVDKEYSNRENSGTVITVIL